MIGNKSRRVYASDQLPDVVISDWSKFCGEMSGKSWYWVHWLWHNYWLCILSLWRESASSSGSSDQESRSSPHKCSLASVQWCNDNVKQVLYVFKIYFSIGVFLGLLDRWHGWLGKFTVFNILIWFRKMSIIFCGSFYEITCL